MDVIGVFRGDHAFLSNFYVRSFRHERRTYKSAEHAYQAAKTKNPTEQMIVRRAPTPSRAKSLGQSVTLREDWDLVKVKVMEDILRSKFRDPLLAHALVSTFPATLIEGNYWGDTFWGECEGKGQNELGKLLMKIRDELRG